MTHTEMIQKQILVLLAGETPHGRIVGRKDGGLPELEQRRHQFVP